ncbi:hypothetical protein [Arthrobacter sp. GMC3]|uniref:hypothetical protein n=1 Tax=Arthrobacter sp. GMC3 TaxID=2058894 RepID=UPI000CE34F8B|nr:hypothetical protein [Arthrobacter sp. GMC3]
MTSWRDSVTEAAQDDLEELLNLALPFAHQCLAKYGEFLPFAAGIGTDGKPVFIMAQPRQEENPESTDVIADCYHGLSERREELRASIVVSNVSLRNQGTDAIHLAAEHAEGVSLSIVQPYMLAGDAPQVGEMSVSLGEQIVWRDSGQ